jgi:hypothetical protein
VAVPADLHGLSAEDVLAIQAVLMSVSGDEVVTRTKALIPLQTGTIADIAYRDVLVRTPDGWRIKDKSTRSYR